MKTKMDTKYTNSVLESGSLRVLGVSESWESRSLGRFGVSNHELYLCQIVLSATRRCSFPCLECPLIVLRNKYCIYTSRQRCNTDVISIDYCLLTSGKK